MRDYSQFSEEHAWDRLPIARAFAYQAASALANPWAKIEIAGDGYILQERLREGRA